MQTTVDCQACGTFKITQHAVWKIDEFSQLRHLLSATTRRASDAGQPLSLTSDNSRGYAESFLGTTLAGKLRNVLELLRKRSSFFGDEAEFNVTTDWPLLIAEGPAEASALIQLAQEHGLVKDGSVLTWDGWQAVETIASDISGFGFVAMSFDDSLRDAFNDGILPAINDCGFRAVRVDREHFNEKICDRILIDIRRSQFTVADFTLQRAGVYFEAGYALALGRVVVWTCREDDVKNLHFDTRQYPHIIWKAPGNLREQLRDRLRALVPGARLL